MYFLSAFALPESCFAMFAAPGIVLPLQNSYKLRQGAWEKYDR